MSIGGRTSTSAGWDDTTINLDLYNADVGPSTTPRTYPLAAANANTTLATYGKTHFAASGTCIIDTIKIASKYNSYITGTFNFICDSISVTEGTFTVTYPAF